MTRYIPFSVRHALTLFSNGLCYWPTCTEFMTVMVEGRPQCNLEAAHIRALHKGGARYDETMTDAERNDIGNLLNLCRPHHRAIDNDHQLKYTVQTLHEWKEEAETGFDSTKLNALGMSADQIEATINDAMERWDDRVDQTLARLRVQDQEAAGLFQELLNATSALQPDPDATMLLHDAATMLANLEDHASILYAASRNLVSLPDSSEALHRVANDLSGLQDTAEALSRSAIEVRRAASMMER